MKTFAVSLQFLNEVLFIQNRLWTNFYCSLELVFYAPIYILIIFFDSRFFVSSLLSSMSLLKMATETISIIIMKNTTQTTSLTPITNTNTVSTMKKLMTLKNSMKKGTDTKPKECTVSNSRMEEPELLNTKLINMELITKYPIKVMLSISMGIIMKAIMEAIAQTKFLLSLWCLNLLISS